MGPLGSQPLGSGPLATLPPAGGGGNVSVTLTGQAATSAAGTIVPAIAVALTGLAATTAQGNVTAGNDVNAALTGQAATMSAGSISVATAAPLPGQAGTTAQGSITAAISAALTGVAGTTSAGTLTPAIAAVLTGVSTSGVPGSVSVSGGSINAALTGQAMTMSQGSMGVIVPSLGGGRHKRRPVEFVPIREGVAQLPPAMARAMARELKALGVAVWNCNSAAGVARAGKITPQSYGVTRRFKGARAAARAGTLSMHEAATARLRGAKASMRARRSAAVGEGIGPLRAARVRGRAGYVFPDGVQNPSEEQLISYALWLLDK